MKLKKKTAIILSFAIGTMMFATTAMAEVVSKSGYDQIKDSLKYTSESCSTKLSSYTVDMSFVVKDNGNIINSENSLNKYNLSNKSMESLGTNLRNGVKRENYYYADKTCFINKNEEQNVYYLTEYPKPTEGHSFKNPFKEKEASDIEKIADALVGNLKDAVVVTQNSDGSKQLSGSLNESQIPSIINALVSLQSKSQFSSRNNNENNMPNITKDIFVKEVKGNMTISKDGLIQNLLGTGVISGKDENGKEHTLTFELLGKLSNINSTTVKKPDLSGKKVEKNIARDDNNIPNPEMYVGKYKTDIIIEKDRKLQKIGERFLDVESIDSKGISGRYHEEFAKGYEDFSTNKKDFKFNGKFEKDSQLNAPFTATNSSGNTVKGHISLSTHSAKIYFNLDEPRRGKILFDDQFSRVFD